MDVYVHAFANTCSTHCICMRHGCDILDDVPSSCHTQTARHDARAQPFTDQSVAAFTQEHIVTTGATSTMFMVMLSGLAYQG